MAFNVIILFLSRLTDSFKTVMAENRQVYSRYHLQTLQLLTQLKPFFFESLQFLVNSRLLRQHVG